MKEIFRKYFNSVLHPDEFKPIADFLTDKKNKQEISEWMKPFWEKEINEKEALTTPNQGLQDKILQAITNHDNKQISQKLNFFRIGLQIAAVLIIGLIISNIFIYRQSAKNVVQIENPATLQTVTVPYGARTSLILPDGSTVWLNSGTTISYLSKFGKTRNVSLDGEAFFKVTKSGIPFIVQTKTGAIEVKGTVFNVRAYNEDIFQTTLLEGAVKVKDKSTDQEVILKPGQQAGITDSQLQVKEVETDLFSSWKDGKLIFRNELLPEVAKRLERWYNVKIELSNDKHLAEISYTGTIEMESFSEVLQLLKVTAPISFTFNEKTRTIKIIYIKNQAFKI